MFRSMVCCDDDFLCGLYGLVSNVHFLGHQVLPGILSCLGAAGKTHPTGHSIGEPYTVAEEIHTGILPSLTAEISPFRLPAERQRSAGQICGYLKDSTLISDKCDSWKYFICEKKAFGSCIWKIQLKATCYTSVWKRPKSKHRRRLMWDYEGKLDFLFTLGNSL